MYSFHNDANCFHYDEKATTNNNKKLQTLFSDYKNKPVDKSYFIQLGNLIYDLQRDDHSLPLRKWLVNADSDSYLKTLKYLLRGQQWEKEMSNE